MRKCKVFFHPDQLLHKPLFEWSFGEKIIHPETTKRAESILNALLNEPQLFEMAKPASIPLQAVLAVHSRVLLKVFKNFENYPKERSFYPSVFPPRRHIKPNPANLQHAGYFCFDSGTPLNHTTFMAARWSASNAYTLAKEILEKKLDFGYALCRPPGHHASRSFFGGYCYLNNTAIAARFLREYGKVAIVDIDFHHGNGTQRIFYTDPKVFTMSLHGDPNIFYPFYEGYENEQGAGSGLGCNLNICLQKHCNGEQYCRKIEEEILPALEKFAPDFLIIAAGFDTARPDPVGGFDIDTKDYKEIASLFAKTKLPTLIIQEGGYHEESLGQNVVSFLKGFLQQS